MKTTQKWILGSALPIAAIIAGCGGSNSGGVTNPTATPVATGTPTVTGTPAATATPVPTVAGPNLNLIVAGTRLGSTVLYRVNARTPGILGTRRTVGGTLVGIDRRPANGRLYGLSSDFRLLDISTGSTPVSSTTLSPAPVGSVGFDFNPVPDRIRVVTDRRLNLRVNPITGAVVDANTDTAGLQTDGTLTYADGDTNASRTPSIVAAAYTNSFNGTVTSTINYAIDSQLGILVTQGRPASAGSAAVSPNTGQLFTVGSLGVNTGNGQVSFDIGPNNVALAIINNSLYSLNLSSGAASLIGRIGSSSDTSITGVQFTGLAVTS